MLEFVLPAGTQPGLYSITIVGGAVIPSGDDATGRPVVGGGTYVEHPSDPPIFSVRVAVPLSDFFAIPQILYSDPVVRHANLTGPLDVDGRFTFTGTFTMPALTGTECLYLNHSSYWAVTSGFAVAIYQVSMVRISPWPLTTKPGSSRGYFFG